MSLDPTEPRLARQLERLGPYLGILLEAAGRRALWLHADHVTLEHLVGATMEDEDTAAHQVVVHAFADPETISNEMLALSPGILLVGSEVTLPFSAQAVEALHAARVAAAEAGAGSVGAGHVLLHAVETLTTEVRALLTEAGFRAWLPGGTEEGGSGVTAEGPLFRHFSDPAKRALSRASRAAGGLREPSIGPAQLALACLQTESALEEACGLRFARARMVLHGRTADRTPPAPRRLTADNELLAFLEALPEAADSLALLLACHRGGAPELRELLDRHKVTEALATRSIGAFTDPPPP